jgi:hypothetical protein
MRPLARSSRNNTRTMTIAKADFIEGIAKGMAVLESFDTERQRLNATLAAERSLGEDELPTGPLHFAAYAGGEEVFVGDAETLAALTLAWGQRPLVAHDWKTLAASEDPSEQPPLEQGVVLRFSPMTPPLCHTWSARQPALNIEPLLYPSALAHRAEL